MAGCVPVAIAQIAYYHKFPSKYDWNNINSIPTATDAFVYFIKDIRSLCNVKYVVDPEPGTGATFNDAKNALKQLGYSIKEGGAPTVSLLRDEISLKHPVYIRGTQKNGGDGHAWVCEGWKERRYEAIATFLLNRNDTKFELTRTSPNGFAVYNTFLYPSETMSTTNIDANTYFYMNLGWGKGYNGWYAYNTNFKIDGVEPFLKDQRTILVFK